MMTRDCTRWAWEDSWAGAPPPLHVYTETGVHAGWHPLAGRPFGVDHADRCELVTLPQNLADLYGDDPTNPGGQSEPRMATRGMLARLNVRTGDRNVARKGVRR